MDLPTLINPIRDDGGLDHRYTGLARQIVDLAGKKCVSELAAFHQYTNDAEARFEKAGLTLVISFFQITMEPWQRRSFKKRLRQCLEEIGFRPSKITKLLTAGEFVAAELTDQFRQSDSYQDWFDSAEAAKAHNEEHIVYLHSHGVTALYHLARMNYKGQAKARSSYDHEIGKPLSVRDLEKLQRQHPAENRSQRSGRGRQPGTNQKANSALPQGSECPKVEVESSVIAELMPLEPSVDSREATTTELAEQLVYLVQSIDWSMIKDNQEAMEVLSTVEYTWSQISEVVDDWKYLPQQLTHA
ncbi:hypothetical protein MY494_02250 [Synechococcus sp. A10-1-5-1]|uniref:hypothetical protein n=1 Tax=Synechococcus sp. A10-1-5-1 TaxID=2936507 RepID=UPI002001A5D7|nr:hypothetical protein [Synechococcus sp. A10-1-5-1]UPM50637.1 hypothetical protein MY494_02250 [Synechococcus sp. A10-1-5-1]